MLDYYFFPAGFRLPVSLFNGFVNDHHSEPWAVEKKVKFLTSEKKMYNEEWFVAGTADAVVEIDGKKYIADWKTGKGVYYEAFIQTAAYRGMLEAMGEKDFHGSLVLHIPQKGLLTEHYRFDYETDLRAFEHALGLYRIINSI